MKLNRWIDTRSLRWMGVIVPLLFWLTVLLVEITVLGESMSWQAALFELILIAGAARLFATWVASSLEWQQREVERRSEHLVALREASLALTNELELANV